MKNLISLWSCGQWTHNCPALFHPTHSLSFNQPEPCSSRFQVTEVMSDDHKGGSLVTRVNYQGNWCWTIDLVQSRLISEELITTTNKSGDWKRVINDNDQHIYVNE